jgi:hypothetical protein
MYDKDKVFFIVSSLSDSTMQFQIQESIHESPPFQAAEYILITHYPYGLVAPSATHFYWTDPATNVEEKIERHRMIPKSHAQRIWNALTAAGYTRILKV